MLRDEGLGEDNYVLRTLREWSWAPFRLLPLASKDFQNPLIKGHGVSYAKVSTDD